MTSSTSRTLLGDRAEYQGGWREVAEGTWAWLQPNGRLGESNAGLVCGGGAGNRGEALLIDTLWDPALTARMLATAPVPAETISVVVNTHGDGDHCWGNQLVAGKRIIAAEGAADDMAEFDPRALAALGRVGSFAAPLLERIPPRARIPGVKPAAAFMGFLRDTGRYSFRGVRLTLPTESFADSLSLDVGGRRVELVKVGPAHTRGDLLVHVPDVGVVFAGDILFSGVTPIMWAGPAENWIAALDRVLAFEPKTVVPGHGPVGEAGAATALRAYWEFVLREGADRHRAGQSALAAAEAMVNGDEFAERGFREWHDAERLGVSLTVLFDKLSGRKSSATLRARGLMAMARLASTSTVADAC
ncbi:MAG: MBL fold metallo-hydrolase [Segniliparus sp.]|uniref:MBL fold metallo-hydrolase n=1 Tax=Segniliparus sp. TaxID=2804064 RepID=UPI003F33BFB9